MQGDENNSSHTIGLSNRMLRRLAVCVNSYRRVIGGMAAVVRRHGRPFLGAGSTAAHGAAVAPSSREFGRAARLGPHPARCYSARWNLATKHASGRPLPEGEEWRAAGLLDPSPSTGEGGVRVIPNTSGPESSAATARHGTAGRYRRQPTVLSRRDVCSCRRKFRTSARLGTAGGWHCQPTVLRAQIGQRIRRVTSENQNLFLPAGQVLAEPLAV